MILQLIKFPPDVSGWSHIEIKEEDLGELCLSLLSAHPQQSLLEVWLPETGERQVPRSHPGGSTAHRAAHSLYLTFLAYEIGTGNTLTDGQRADERRQ